MFYANNDYVALCIYKSGLCILWIAPSDIVPKHMLHNILYM